MEISAPAITIQSGYRLRDFNISGGTNGVQSLIRQASGKSSEHDIPGEFFLCVSVRFAVGESSETGLKLLQRAGMVAVLSEYIPVTLQRNAANIGVPALACAGLLPVVGQGDSLTINLDMLHIYHASRSDPFIPEDPPEYLHRLLLKGGVLSALASEITKEGSTDAS